MVACWMGMLGIARLIFIDFFFLFFGRFKRGYRKILPLQEEAFPPSLINST